MKRLLFAAVGVLAFSASLVVAADEVIIKAPPGFAVYSDKDREAFSKTYDAAKKLGAPVLVVGAPGKVNNEVYRTFDAIVRSRATKETKFRVFLQDGKIPNTLNIHLSKANLKMEHVSACVVDADGNVLVVVKHGVELRDIDDRLGQAVAIGGFKAHAQNVLESADKDIEAGRYSAALNKVTDIAKDDAKAKAWLSKQREEPAPQPDKKDPKDKKADKPEKKIEKTLPKSKEEIGPGMYYEGVVDQYKTKIGEAVKKKIFEIDQKSEDPKTLRIAFDDAQTLARMAKDTPGADDATVLLQKIKEKVASEKPADKPAPREKPAKPDPDADEKGDKADKPERSAKPVAKPDRAPAKPGKDDKDMTK